MKWQWFLLILTEIGRKKIGGKQHSSVYIQLVSNYKNLGSPELDMLYPAWEIIKKPQQTQNIGKTDI